MAEELTLQQRQAVEDRGGKLLVSAAAGSGKTKVLVDRLLSYILQSDGKVNIDDFLIITYTKAAAAELRGKIAAKLNEHLSLCPENKHLQRQSQRLYLAKISTVHSFCGDILREYAYRLDIPGDFRIAEEQECQILQLQVLEKIMEQIYDAPSEDILTFIDSQERGRDDSSIPGIILQVYRDARCHLSPSEWLQKCVSASDTTGLTDASETLWGQYLIRELQHNLDLQIQAISKCAQLARDNGTMDKPAALLYDTLYQLERLRAYNSWDDIVNHRNIDYGRLVFSPKCTDKELVGRIKAVRDSCKKTLERKLLPFADLSQQVLSDLESCGAAIRGLIQLVDAFSQGYEKAKKARRILDFGDLEHKMLDLVVGKDRNGVTSLAHEIGNRYVEIMVDEYQDSNAVQDAIFAALTEKRQNCFMVGDVKQSIYQFRLADPGIFLEKYNAYVPAEQAKPGEGRIVMLSNNFRSAAPVIQAVNDVFSSCMTKSVGGLDYTQNEYLYEGIPHISVNEPEIELTLLEVKDDTYAEEAAYTADRIVQLLDGTHMIRQGKDSLRPITCDDIVILLRSPGSVGAEFQLALEARGIRVNSGSGADLLQTEEISFIRSLMQIISNPLQDIPLIAALTSRILCFTADDLAVIRAGKKRLPFYEALRKSDSEKAVNFVSMLQGLREDARVCTVTQLMDKILDVTRLDSVYSSFSDGAVKKVNVQTFCNLIADCERSNIKELGQFLDYLEVLDNKGLSVTSEHKVPGAVTIMSIHKSKGLEFPVVFLCGLSRDFNFEDARSQVLCNKELGIGLSIVDLNKRIRYPSIAQKAISAKIISDSVSEEMRVLYVAMTRPKDRLIMTYAVKNPAADLSDLVNRMDICDRELITAGTSCPGTWILLTALQRAESGALFALAGKPERVYPSDIPWSVLITSAEADAAMAVEQTQGISAPTVDIERLRISLSFRYAHSAATLFASKQTATQLKGRYKDQEAADHTPAPKQFFRNWRKPSFAAPDGITSTGYGNAVHKVMQHLNFKACDSLSGISGELDRMVEAGYLSEQEINAVDPDVFVRFFQTALGKKLICAENVLREFKFSVLDDAAKYGQGLDGEQILLQGVVDCAIIEADGITVLDFKTDSVGDSSIEQVALQYRAQVLAYARALSKIYQCKVKSAQLYFFKLNRFVEMLDNL